MREKCSGRAHIPCLFGDARRASLAFLFSRPTHYKTRYLRDGSNLPYPSDGWKGRFCHNLSIASLCGVDHPSTVFWWNIDSFSGYGSLYFSRPFFVKESMIRRNSFSDVKWSVDLEKTLFEVGHHWRNRWKSRKMMFFCHLEKKYH